MGIFDAMTVKYGAVMGGYAILGLPVFRNKGIGKNTSASHITKQYIKNSSLLINLAKVIINKIGCRKNCYIIQRYAKSLRIYLFG